MAAFGKRIGGGRRSATRLAAPLKVVFTSMTFSDWAVLVDLSPTGARLRGMPLPQVGEELFVNIEQTKLFGSVAWAKNNECGVTFDEPIPNHAMHDLRHKILLAHGVRPEFKAAFEDWTGGLAR